MCEKSDGMRYLLYLTEDPLGREAHFLIDRRNDFWYVPFEKLHFPIPKNTAGYHINTIIDGELVMDKVPGGGTQPKYLVFDCMVLDGNSLMNRTLDKRLAYFKERVMDPYLQLLQDFPSVSNDYVGNEHHANIMIGKTISSFHYGNEIYAARLRY